MRPMMMHAAGMPHMAAMHAPGGVSVHPMTGGPMGQDYQRAYRQALVSYLMQSQRPSQGRSEQEPGVTKASTPKAFG